LADVGALARKDLLLELRARDTLPAMLLFVVSALVVFHFVLPAGSSDFAATGLLWIALLFTALLGLSRAFAAEREQGVIDGLVVAIVVGGVGASVADDPARYIGLLGLYDALFAIICWASFEYVVTE